MRKWAVLLALVVLGFVLLHGWNAVQAKANDEAEIRALTQRWNEAFQAKDANGVMANYLPGDDLFVFDVVPPRQYVGAAAYKKDYEDFFRMFSGPIKSEISELKITTNGSDIAYSHCIDHFTATTTDGKPINLTVRVTDDFRKVKGKWLIAVEHVSVPVDLDTGKPDLQSKP
jgi:uncharacterized protein (TIGR02246 family)